MRVQRIYLVVLTAVLADGTTARTKQVKVQASSEERAVDHLKSVIERQTQQQITSVIFSKVEVW